MSTLWARARALFQRSPLVDRDLDDEIAAHLSIWESANGRNHPGLYGVMAYSVIRRTREIGLRMAMGASVPQVAWLVMRDALTLVAIGVAIGLPAAWFASRYIEAQLYQVQTADPMVMAAAVLGLAVVAAKAGLIPAWRATRVNPVIALRYE